MKARGFGFVAALVVSVVCPSLVLKMFFLPFFPFSCIHFFLFITFLAFRNGIFVIFVLFLDILLLLFFFCIRLIDEVGLVMSASAE